MAVEMDENLDLQQQMDDAIYYHYDIDPKNEEDAQKIPQSGQIPRKAKMAVEMDENHDLQHYDIEPKNEKGAQKIMQSGIRWYKRVAASLGFLSAILFILTIAVPLSLHHSNMVERDRERQSFQTGYNQLIVERDQLKNKCNNLTRRVCEADGFTFRDGMCYYISTENKTWEESRQWCRRANQSDLMVIKSKEKQNFVERVLDANANHKFWLGLTDRDRGSFQWVDGTPLTTPTYWLRYQPNYNGPCVEFNVNGKGWNDNNCSVQWQWICERVLC